LFGGQSFPRPEQILATDFDRMRSCGFSGGKIATIQGIAQATLDGVVPDYATALAMDDEALIERLISLRGVGRWTVEMLLIYSLERMDILPADDFGVREGYRRLKSLDVQPTRKQMIDIGQAWSPHRTVAAWYLWRVAKP
jgi:DNA-3-methyladenine glycosylase II